MRDEKQWRTFVERNQISASHATSEIFGLKRFFLPRGLTSPIISERWRNLPLFTPSRKSQAQVACQKRTACSRHLYFTWPRAPNPRVSLALEQASRARRGQHCTNSPTFLFLLSKPIAFSTHFSASVYHSSTTCSIKQINIDDNHFE